MSHFSVLVINTKGQDDVDDQLFPFKEEVGEGDPQAVFNDTTDEYKEEYETGTRAEFYCNSSSSWGMQLNKDTRTKLGELEIGDHMVIEVGDDPMSYVKLNHKYHTYEMKFDEENDREIPDRDKEYWWEVVNILENNSNNPQPDICFKGRVRIRKITSPKELPLKSFYESFEDFCNDWHGSEPNEDGVYGYYNNPNAKWDWYQVGGRWAGRLPLKDGIKKIRQPNFSHGWDEKEKQKVLLEGTVDQANKNDIDWTKLHNVDQKKHERFWELVVEESKPLNEKEEETVKWNFYKPSYYLDKYKNKETYVKARSAFHTYAAVIDGKWVSAGEMGMFGISHGENDDELEFELNFMEKIIDPLPDDALITMVDCHI